MLKPFSYCYLILALLCCTSNTLLEFTSVEGRRKSQPDEQSNQVIQADTNVDLLDDDLPIGPAICINCSLDANKYKLIDRIDKLGYPKVFPRDDDIVINKLAISGFYNNNQKQYILNGALRKVVYPSLDYSLSDGAESEAVQLVNDLKIDQRARNICIRNGTYCLNDQIFKGGHGEIFRAYTIDIDGNVFRNVSYILKRMQTSGKFHIKMCAEREIFFGNLLRGVPNMPRFVTHFVTDEDYWLVYRDEGISLQQLFYAMTVDSFSVMLKPSNVWRNFRTTEFGLNSMRSLLRQIILHVSELHKKEILHRDIKLSNILLNTENPGRPHVVINDFSSAMSEDALRLNLFAEDSSSSSDLSGGGGPTQAELTMDYAAPEVRLSADAGYSYDPDYPYSYDIFSVGVVFLEMLLGTQKVFEVLDERTVAMIRHRLRSNLHHRNSDTGSGSESGSSIDNEATYERVLEQTLLLTALADYGIFDPTIHVLPSEQQGGPSDECGERSQRAYSMADTVRDAMHSESDKHHHRHVSSSNSDADTNSDENFAGSSSSSSEWVPIRASAAANNQRDAEVCRDGDVISAPSTAVTRVSQVTSDVCQNLDTTSSSSSSSSGKVVDSGWLGWLSNWVGWYTHPLTRWKKLLTRWCDMHRKLWFPMHSQLVKRSQLGADLITAEKCGSVGYSKSLGSKRQLPNIQSLLEHLQPTLQHMHTSSSNTRSSSYSFDTRTHAKSRNHSSSSLNAYTHERLRQAILRRDPLGLGYDDEWGIDLLSRLLAYNPAERITLADALEHAYFTGPYICDFDGSAHPTASALNDHIERHHSPHSEAGLVAEGIASTLNTSESGGCNSSESNCSLVVAPYGNTALATAAASAADSDSMAALWFECASRYESLFERLDEGHLFSLPVATSDIAADSRDMLGSLSKSIAAAELDDEHAEVSSPDDAACRLLMTSTKAPSSVLPTDAYVSPDEATAEDEDGDDMEEEKEEEESECDACSERPRDRLEVRFRCPRCGRWFDDYDGCVSHVLARKHGSRCISYYNASSYSSSDITRTEVEDTSSAAVAAAAVPPELHCLSTRAYSLQPVDECSGWCDLRGRRLYMEDRHSMSREREYSYYAVYDGHYGSRASRFMARNHHDIFRHKLLEQLHNYSGEGSAAAGSDAVDEEQSFDFSSMQVRSERMLAIANAESAVEWNRVAQIVSDRTEVIANSFSCSGCGSQQRLSVGQVVQALYQSFVYADREFLLLANAMPQGRGGSSHVYEDDQSGTTTALVIVFPSHLVVGNVGDSRVVLCCDAAGAPVRLTVDHTPRTREERDTVIARGGFVTDDIYNQSNSVIGGANHRDKIPRVNGQLAVTRSVGDRRFKPVLSALPDILVLRRHLQDSSLPGAESEHSTPAGDINPCQEYRRFLQSSSSGKADAHTQWLFLIVASDGVWDHVSSRDAADIVCHHLLSNSRRMLLASARSCDIDENGALVDEFNSAAAASGRGKGRADRGDSDSGSDSDMRSNTHNSVSGSMLYHDAAALLAREAYLKGSSDNIGACVVNLYV